MRDEYRANLAVKYAEVFLGTPYRWGGDDPMAGFDCSGLINEILQALGFLPHGVDYTAEGLRKIYEPQVVGEARPGCLIFWTREGKAVHVEIAKDGNFTIGASGGGSATNTIQDAVDQNAFVKLRPINYRTISGRIIADPFK